MANSADPDHLASSSQLIWIYTVCKGSTYPGSAGQGLIFVFFCSYPRCTSCLSELSHTLAVQSPSSVSSSASFHLPYSGKIQYYDIALDKMLFSTQKYGYFSYFSTKHRCNLGPFKANDVVS